MAFYSVAIMGMQPIGALLSGMVADRIGSEMTIFYGGLACLAGCVWFAIRRPMLRHEAFVLPSILRRRQPD